MAHKPAVHIEFRGEGWAVVREGNKRATSTHPTQSKAAETGRDLARRDKSEFFLHAQYGIYDQYGERIGPVSDLFVDENDEPEYVGVETGLPGNRSLLIPAEAITGDDRLRRMVVSHPRSLVESAPSLGYEDEVTPEFERRVRGHHGL